MSSHCSVLIVLALAGAATGCKRDVSTHANTVRPRASRFANVPSDASTDTTMPNAVTETATPTTPAETAAPNAPVETAPPSAPGARLDRRSYAETNEAPPVAPTPAPQPPPPPRPPSPQVVVVQQPPAPPPPPTVVIVQQQSAPGGPEAAAAPQTAPPIVASPYAPTAAGTVNEAGIVVPAVPLNIDPGAAPGAPGNGAPDPKAVSGR